MSTCCTDCILVRLSSKPKKRKSDIMKISARALSLSLALSSQSELFVFREAVYPDPGCLSRSGCCHMRACETCPIATVL